MTIKEIIEIIATLVGIILTVAIIHFTVANRSKTKADNIQLLWERIDTLEVKLNEEISKSDRIIDTLRKRINQLEARLREYGIPLPQDDDEMQPPKPAKGLGMKR